MMKKKLLKSNSSGGYQKKKIPLHKIPPQEKPAPVADNRIPVPSHIKEALVAKRSLLQHLNRLYASHKTVSLGVRENAWVLEVRGVDPLLSYYDEFEVVYVPSKLVRNPKAQMA